MTEEIIVEPQTNYTVKRFYTDKEYNELEQENKELLKYETYYLDKYIELRDSLEEIREIAVKELYLKQNSSLTKIIDKINEVLK